MSSLFVTATHLKENNRGNYAEGILRGGESSQGNLRRGTFGRESPQRGIFEEGNFREGESSRRGIFGGEFSIRSIFAERYPYGPPKYAQTPIFDVFLFVFIMSCDIQK
jgi:hypothetical protein